MIDRGLAVSIGIVAAAVWLAARRIPARTFDPSRAFDVLAGPVLLGLLVGRLTAMALTDIGGLAHVRDVLVVRGGVELWPAVAAGALVLVRAARREGVPAALRIVDVAPFVLVGMAAFDGSCLVREGCFGPTSAVGLVPPGLESRVAPLGLLTAATTVLAGVVVWRRWPRNPLSTAFGAVFFVAAQRAVVSIWLPRFGPGLTRQHLTSITVAVLVGAALVGLRLFDPISSAAALPEDRTGGGSA